MSDDQSDTQLHDIEACRPKDTIISAAKMHVGDEAYFGPERGLIVQVETRRKVERLREAVGSDGSAV